MLVPPALASSRRETLPTRATLPLHFPPAMTPFSWLKTLRDRRRIQRRFSNYVDPQLVNYIADHPEPIRIPHRPPHPMTLGLATLSGFTTLPEPLAENTIPLLNAWTTQAPALLKQHKAWLDTIQGPTLQFAFGVMKPSPPNTSPNDATRAIGLAKALTKISIHPNLKIHVALSTGPCQNPFDMNVCLLGPPTLRLPLLLTAARRHHLPLLADAETLTSANLPLSAPIEIPNDEDPALPPLFAYTLPAG